MAQTGVFKGFSTHRGLSPLYDMELVNQDLLNHINTHKGEKLMDPEFGCVIHDLLFELKSPAVLNDIKNDLIRIINSDPRVQLRKLDVFEQEHGYSGSALLFYNHLATTGELLLQFTSEQQNIN